MHSAGGQRDDPVPAHSFTLGGILKSSANLVYLSFEIKQKSSMLISVPKYNSYYRF